MLEQTWIKFYKISPGGNTTILLDTTQVTPEFRPACSNIVMNSLHLEAEQVGFIDWPNEKEKNTKLNIPSNLNNLNDPHEPNAPADLAGPAGLAGPVGLAGLAGSSDVGESGNLGNSDNSGKSDNSDNSGKSDNSGNSGNLGEKNISFSCAQQLPALNMMGGEFCGNACRSYASVLALTSGKPLPWRGEIATSGIDTPISCFVQQHQGQLDSAINVPLSSDVSIEPFEGGALVRLPGITHILLPGNEDHHLEITDDLKKCALNWKRKLNLLNEPAVGCIWFDFCKQSANMLPLVWVRNTNSYCFETACGSGAIALGLYLGTVVKQKNCGQPDTKLDPKKGSGVHSSPYSGCSHFYHIMQPSGQALWVAYNLNQAKMPAHVWLGGPCRIIARGETVI